MADLTAAQTANLGMGANPFLGQSNPYLQSQIDNASQDVVNNYNLTTQPAFNAQMVNSGSFGNEGVSQMNAQAQNMLQKNLGQLSNQFRSQDYSNQMNEYNWQQQQLQQQGQYNTTQAENQRQFNLGFGRQTFNDAYSQNMNNLTTGIGLLGTLGTYNANDLTNANAQQNAPLNYWSQFSNAANSMGQGYGTDTSVKGTTSNPFAAMLGGAQLGNSAYNWWNQQQNQGVPAPVSSSQQQTIGQYFDPTYTAGA